MIVCVRLTLWCLVLGYFILPPYFPVILYDVRVWGLIRFPDAYERHAEPIIYLEHFCVYECVTMLIHFFQSSSCEVVDTDNV